MRIWRQGIQQRGAEGNEQRGAEGSRAALSVCTLCALTGGEVFGHFHSWFSPVHSLIEGVAEAHERALHAPVAAGVLRVPVKFTQRVGAVIPVP